jgi:hypothetical protein
MSADCDLDRLNQSSCSADLRFGKRPLTQEDLEKTLRARLESEAARRRVDQLIKRI